MKLICIELPNGRLRIRKPVEAQAKNETEQDYLSRLAQQNLPAGATVLGFVESSAVPEDRTFRAALEYQGPNSLKINMAKAPTIQMDRIRQARNAKLIEKDLEFLQAMSKFIATDDMSEKAKAAQVEQERQTLRDIPQTFDLSGATTPEELKALWPSELPKKAKGKA